MKSEIAHFLSQQLYPDIKTWVASLGRMVRTPIRRFRAEVFESPTALLTALATGRVQSGDLVTLKCKPSPFGPFLRSHFLSPIIGSHSDMREGPPIGHENPFLGIMAQSTSHLKPVGLFPPLGNGVHQACLYPDDTQACGFVGLLPGIESLVEHVPALVHSRHTQHFGSACHITGAVRLVDAEVVGAVGLSLEDYEGIRQAGNVWYLDCTIDESKCTSIDDGLTTEMWGGLYASGHLEIEGGKLTYRNLVGAFSDSISQGGFEPKVTQNQAGRKEIMVYAKGIRALVDTQFPMYSVHMDAEIAINFATYRARFDSIITNLLNAIREVASDGGAELSNPLDLDFTYTDSSQAFSVLRSQGAQYIDNPIAIGIRDWHSQRGRSSD